MDARQGRGSLRRARSAGLQGRRDDGEEPAVDGRLVHGPDAAHDRQRDRPRVVHPAARARQRRRLRAAAPTSSAATTTCRARPTSARTRTRCPATTASRRARGSTTRRSGASTTSGSRSSTPTGMMEKPGMTVSRWIDGVLEKNDLIDQGPNLRAHGVLGPRAEQPDARQGDGRGDEEARPAGRHRPVSVGDRGDGGDGAQGRRLPAAGVHAVRDVGLGDRVEPLAAVARARDHARCSSRRPTTRSCTRSRRSSAGTRSSSRTTRCGSRTATPSSKSPTPESILKEINRSNWTIGYTGQSPERLKLHMKNMNDVRREDAPREGRPVRRRLLRSAVAVLRHAGIEASRARRTSTRPRAT